MSETKAKFATREEWLHAATEKLQATFTRAGHDIPPVQIACGWPSSRGLGAKKRALGECWDKACSADKKAQIFISPWMDGEINLEKDATDGMGVLPTLAHELVHAVVGNEAAHGKVFGKLARAIGLEGKLTSTHASDVLLNECAEIAKLLGPYPHARINPLDRKGKKKQGTRMLKCECEECGFTVRTTKKWLTEVGAPHCPKHGAMSHEPLDGDDDEEGDE